MHCVTIVCILFHLFEHHFFVQTGRLGHGAAPLSMLDLYLHSPTHLVGCLGTSSRGPFSFVYV